MNNERYLLVVSGPSGAGKDTVVSALCKNYPEIEISVSATTRNPREGEEHGVNYYFLTNDEFEQKIKHGQMLEFANYCGNYYGTPKSEVDKRIENKQTVVLVIEVEGAANIKKMYPECTTIFVTPPSVEELENRLRSRNTDSEEAIKNRLKRAEEEMALADTYDYQIVNDEIEPCAQRIYNIIKERQT